LRENTERPVTVTQGTNRLVGPNPERIVTEALGALDNEGRCGARAGGCEAVDYSRDWLARSVLIDGRHVLAAGQARKTGWRCRCVGCGIVESRRRW